MMNPCSILRISSSTSRMSDPRPNGLCVEAVRILPATFGAFAGRTMLDGVGARAPARDAPRPRAYPAANTSTSSWSCPYAPACSGRICSIQSSPSSLSRMPAKPGGTAELLPLRAAPRPERGVDGTRESDENPDEMEEASDVRPDERVDAVVVTLEVREWYCECAPPTRSGTRASDDDDDDDDDAPPPTTLRSRRRLRRSSRRSSRHLSSCATRR